MRAGAESEDTNEGSQLGTGFQRPSTQHRLLPPTCSWEPARTRRDQKTNATHRPGTQDGDLPAAANPAPPHQHAEGRQSLVSRCRGGDAGPRGFPQGPHTSKEARLSPHTPTGQQDSPAQGRGWGRADLLPPSASFLSNPLIPTTTTGGILTPLNRCCDRGSERLKRGNQGPCAQTELLFFLGIPRVSLW